MKTEDREKMGEIYEEGFGLSPENEMQSKLDNKMIDDKKLQIIGENMQVIIEATVQKYNYLIDVIEKFPGDMKAKNELITLYKRFERFFIENLKDAPDQTDMPLGLAATEFEQEEDIY